MTNELYGDFYDLVYVIIDRIAAYWQIQRNQFRWKHVYAYLKEVEDVDFYPVQLGKVSSRFLSGSLIKAYGCVAITYNKEMLTSRQHFTILHEAGHFFFDLNTQEHTQNFSDLINEDGYPECELLEEQRANIFASLTLATDEALEELITARKTFSQICKELEISQAALQHRLTDYLQFIFLLNPLESQRMIQQYRYQNKPSLYEFTQRFYQQKNIIHFVSEQEFPEYFI